MDVPDLVRRVQNGEIKLHELEDHANPETAVKARREIFESRLNVTLS